MSPTAVATPQTTRRRNAGLRPPCAAQGYSPDVLDAIWADVVRRAEVSANDQSTSSAAATSDETTSLITSTSSDDSILSTTSSSSSTTSATSTTSEKSTASSSVTSSSQDISAISSLSTTTSQSTKTTSSGSALSSSSGTSTSASASATSTQTASDKEISTILGIVIGSAAIVVILVTIGYFVCRRRRTKELQDDHFPLNTPSPYEPSTMASHGDYSATPRNDDYEDTLEGHRGRFDPLYDVGDITRQEEEHGFLDQTGPDEFGYDASYREGRGSRAELLPPSLRTGTSPNIRRSLGTGMSGYGDEAMMGTGRTEDFGTAQSRW
ncbi:hypothetical protein P7C70_g2553, partial [Phenoliferia sp. Uapishka_3]